jgi:hypothetical protein
MGNIGAELIALLTANKWLSWGIFWLGWLMISPATLPAGSIAFMVGYVIYRERTLNLATIAAAYLGVCLYLLLGHISNDWPEQVRLYMGWGMIFSVIVLAIRYPTLGYFLIVMICSAVSRGGYYRRRRW